MMGEANLRYARGDTEDAETICKEIIRQCEYRTLGTEWHKLLTVTTCLGESLPGHSSR